MDELMSFYAVRKNICSKLVENGYELFTDYKPIKGGISVDIVAIKGKIRKQKLFIMIVSDIEGEIELGVNLLRSISDSVEKLVVVNTKTSKTY